MLIRFSDPEIEKRALGFLVRRFQSSPGLRGKRSFDPATAKVTICLTFPSAGDTSYPGLVWHEGLLHVSYYSTHEGKTSIYFAKVRLP